MAHFRELYHVILFSLSNIKFDLCCPCELRYFYLEIADTSMTYTYLTFMSREIELLVSC